jgi:thioredoxin 1
MSSFNDIINSDKPVLVDFSAEWCGPCKMMPPILKQVKNELGSRVKILKIDVDKNPAIAQRMQIRNVPTLAIYKNGREVFRQAGVLQAAQLIPLIQQHTT